MIILAKNPDDDFDEELAREASRIAKLEKRVLIVSGVKGNPVEGATHSIPCGDDVKKIESFLRATNRPAAFAELIRRDESGRIVLVPLIARDAPNETREEVTDKTISIKAVAVAATNDCVLELNDFFRQWRLFHPEIPIFALVCENDRHLLEQKWFEDSGIKIEIVTAEYVTSLLQSSKSIYTHNEYWNVPAIALKLEALKRCLLHYRRASLLCDSDIVLTTRLPVIEWHADAVFSTHQGPFFEQSHQPGQGFYNAGMVLVRNTKFVARWREMFLTGKGGFYEQGCLELLSKEFVVDTFPSSWNWGIWRTQENLAQSKRRSPILHVHTKTTKRPPMRRDCVASLVDLAEKTIERGKRLESMPSKILFVHHPKSAGTSVMQHLHHAAEDFGFQLFDSWNAGLSRDFTPEELRHLCHGNFFSQRGKRFIVHNHAHNIPDDVLHEFKENGWIIVALYRPIEDRLASSFSWSKRQLELGEAHPMGEEFNDALDFKSHLKTLLEHCAHQFTLTKAHRELSKWFMTNDDGIRSMLLHLFGEVSEEILAANVSNSLSFEELCKESDLSRRALKSLSSNAVFKSWDDFNNSP